MKHRPARRGAVGVLGTRGITLIELLIVIVLVGILTGIAGSRLDWGRYRTDSASRELLTEMAKAQRLAVSLQANVRFVVSGERSIQIHEDADNNNAVGTGERVRTVVLDPSIKIGKGSTPNVPGPSDPAEISNVVFRRDGSASRGGTFYLVATATDATCKRCRAVSIVRATGRATLYSMSTGTWRRAN